MSAGDPGEDPLNRAEARLRDLLEPLSRNAPRSGRVLVDRTLRTVRWQRHVRGPLQLVGHLAGAAADAARLLLAGPRRR